MDSMIILYGPTGVGKSDIALELAQSIPAEIVNMDVGQLYTPLSIGTAKPAWKEQLVPHHLFDVIDEPRHCSVVEYRNMVLVLVKQIRERGNIPILVGGSGFYLKSLFFPPLVDGMAIQDEKLQIDWDTLYAIDPERARFIQPNDTYRIQRALEVWHHTGIKPSTYKPQYENVFGTYHIYHITRNRDDLYARINERVEIMFTMGWQEEVASLKDSEWIPFIERKKIIGYNEISAYIEGNGDSYASLVQRIQKRTRHYARRQEIFWRMLSSHIDHALYTTVNLTSLSNSIYLKQLTDTYVCKEA